MILEENQLKDSSYNFDSLKEFLSSIPEGEKLKSCIQCGSCSSSCPAAENIASTRRHLWRMLQMGMLDEVIASKLFWDCTTCSMCEIRCPRGIPLGDIINKLREKYNERLGLLDPMKLLTATLEKSKNITGDENKNRLLWTENIEGISEADRAKLVKDKAEVVYFAGCVSSLFPQSYKIPQSLTRILLQTGVDFSLLGENEWCCGYPLFGAGCSENVIKEYAKHNLAVIKDKGAKTILVSCPTCYHMLENEYPKILGKELDIEIKHYVEFLPDLMSQNTNFKSNEVTVTYHDPCDLGRKSGVIEAPRVLLRKLPGVVLKEMRFNGVDSKCCGGGGNLEMLNPELSFDIAQKRVEEALDTGAQYLITTCQQCKRTLQNAARKMRARIKVYDLLEFMAERITTESGGERP